MKWLTYLPEEKFSDGPNRHALHGSPLTIRIANHWKNTEWENNNDYKVQNENTNKWIQNGKWLAYLPEEKSLMGTKNMNCVRLNFYDLNSTRMIGKKPIIKT